MVVKVWENSKYRGNTPLGSYPTAFLYLANVLLCSHNSKETEKFPFLHVSYTNQFVRKSQVKP